LSFKKSAKSKIDRVRQILLSDWDPIVVGGNPKLQDEYDSFIGRILSFLSTKTQPDLVDLVSLLKGFEKELGVNSEKATLEKVAKKLKNLFAMGAPET